LAFPHLFVVYDIALTYIIYYEDVKMVLAEFLEILEESSLKLKTYTMKRRRD